MESRPPMPQLRVEDFLSVGMRAPDADCPPSVPMISTAKDVDIEFFAKRRSANVESNVLRGRLKCR